MGLILYHILTFSLAFLLSLYFTPIMRRGALRFGILDRPDGRLKRHPQPVPYLGGVAVYFSFLLTVSFSFPFTEEALGLTLSGTILLLVGLLDDLGSLPPAVKLAAQTFAIFVLARAGVYIKLVFLPPWANLSLTFLWLLAITNAFNILDVMDGLAAGVGGIAAIGFAIVSTMNGRIEVATMAVALGGSLWGFMRYNFAPAKIFLGDAGSMFIGFLLGGLAVVGSYSWKNPLGFLAPAVVLGVPIFDTLLVIYSRLKKGISPFRGSPDHFAIKLQGLGLSPRKVALLSYGVGGGLAGLGIGMMEMGSWRAVLVISLLLLILAIWGILIIDRMEGR